MFRVQKYREIKGKGEAGMEDLCYTEKEKTLSEEKK